MCSFLRYMSTEVPPVLGWKKKRKGRGGGRDRHCIIEAESRSEKVRVNERVRDTEIQRYKE